ncbi:hypothetical protein OG21DRAFT_1495942 [Imleria badia]|nr:hypothetical protein OG21DRAFT_1495942 [Imleria badia]
MSKRKHEMDVDSDSDEPTPDLVDVNFDYYNVTTDDYHAIHRLFIQLFGADAERVQTGALTDLVTSVAAESGVGSTIKTEEEEGSAAYAILTVISCRDHPGLQTVVDHVLSKTSADEVFHNTLSLLLQNHHVGLVLSERLINMPVQVMGPMYRMLCEEIDEAIGDGEAYKFTHYLFVSRVYRLTAEEEAAQRNTKRHRADTRHDGVYGFHGEDEEIIQHATHSVTYESGRAMLVPAEKFKEMVKNMETMYKVE